MIAALGVFTGIWFVTQKGNIGWDGFLAVFIMVATIVIQASQNRDSNASTQPDTWATPNSGRG